MFFILCVFLCFQLLSCPCSVCVGVCLCVCERDTPQGAWEQSSCGQRGNTHVSFGFHPWLVQQGTWQHAECVCEREFGDHMSMCLSVLSCYTPQTFCFVTISKPSPSHCFSLSDDLQHQKVKSIWFTRSTKASLRKHAQVGTQLSLRTHLAHYHCRTQSFQRIQKKLSFFYTAMILAFMAAKSSLRRSGEEEVRKRKNWFSCENHHHVSASVHRETDKIEGRLDWLNGGSGAD